MTVNRRTLIGTVCAISVFGVPLISSAQTGTRSNPIKIVVPYPPGGPLDVSARAIAEAVHADLGNVIVDNRPGAGGNRGVTYLAQQKPVVRRSRCHTRRQPELVQEASLRPDQRL